MVADLAATATAKTGGTGKKVAPKYRDTDLSKIHVGTISRADVARFVVDQLIEDKWLRRSPLIYS